jgi:hypothetical protein
MIRDATPATSAPNESIGVVLEVFMTSRALRVSACSCAVAILLAISVSGRSADQQQPPFRSGTKTVAVYATVNENNGRLVPDLTAKTARSGR